MIEEAFGKRVSREDLEEILPDYSEIDKRMVDYMGTNMKSANEILNNIMDDEEKQRLEEVFLDLMAGIGRLMVAE